MWDAGAANGKPGTRGATADFLSGLIGSLPPVHELAHQAGIELSGALGRIDRSGDALQANGETSDRTPPRPGKA